jgi:hypothetical protein
MRSPSVKENLKASSKHNSPLLAWLHSNHCFDCKGHLFWSGLNHSAHPLPIAAQLATGLLLVGAALAEANNCNRQVTGKICGQKLLTYTKYTMHNLAS